MPERGFAGAESHYTNRQLDCFVQGFGWGLAIPSPCKMRIENSVVGIQQWRGRPRRSCEPGPLAVNHSSDRTKKVAPLWDGLRKQTGASAHSIYRDQSGSITL